MLRNKLMIAVARSVAFVALPAIAQQGQSQQGQSQQGQSQQSESPNAQSDNQRIAQEQVEGAGTKIYVSPAGSEVN